MSTPDRKRRRTALAVTGVAFGMIGLSFASVPLYKIFCAFTGYGGTPQRVAQDSTTMSDRVITIRFNADVNPGLPWKFYPEQSEVKVRVGENALIYYKAENHSDEPVIGQATYNVTPLKAGLYFDKVACFCFSEQTLKPRETVEMPVSFFVSPEILKDRNADDVHTITLSYSFFRAKGVTAKPVADTEVPSQPLQPRL